jgi:hypothetical protein
MKRPSRFLDLAQISSDCSGHNNRTAIKANPKAARPLSTLVGNNIAISPPARTPIELASNKATTEPKNTARGCLLLPPKAIAANWLLSPISAIKTVVNVNARSCKSMREMGDGSNKCRVGTVLTQRDLEGTSVMSESLPTSYNPSSKLVFCLKHSNDTGNTVDRIQTSNFS